MTVRRVLRLLAVPWAALASIAPLAAAPGEPFVYQRAPEPIASALKAPARPQVLVSPTLDKVALFEHSRLPPIAQIAEPELRLAGLSVNPATNGPSRTLTFSALTVHDLATGKATNARLPVGSRLINARWSPDGRSLAFLLLRPDTVELWTFNAAGGSTALLARNVNAAFPEPFEWFAEGSALLVRQVPKRRGPPPEVPAAPVGPVIRDTTSDKAAATTIQNLLTSPADRDLFEYYGTSQLAIVSLASRKIELVGEPAIFAETAPSSDGRFILVKKIGRPFSLALPYSAFPEQVSVIDRNARTVKTIVDRREPRSSLDIPDGPRSVQWRRDAPASLFWAEADRSDPARDRLYTLGAPFRAAPTEIARLDFRFQDIRWSSNELALVSGLSLAVKARRRAVIDPSGRQPPRQVPPSDGRPVGRLVEWREGMLALTPDGRAAWVALDDGYGRFDLATGAVTRSSTRAPGETMVELLDSEGRTHLSWLEGKTAPPNLFATGEGARVQLTWLGDPAPAYAGMQVRKLAYSRSDGRHLSGTLYLPAGYREERDLPLPVLIWAYPNVVRNDVQQSTASTPTQRFERPSGFSDLPQMMTGRGYAVFQADMPLFAVGNAPANDSYVSQIVANAGAAVEMLVGLGVARRDRIAIGGHSYGAGMVASLLANSDLFRTGVSLSGAYNRTLTPFGFQASERRNFWEAPEAYLAMSPFVQADRIKEPILLIHGSADSNSGTYPMQSERLYSAISGLGGEARLVILPFEDHQYRAEESLMHVMWEIDHWLGEQLK